MPDIQYKALIVEDDGGWQEILGEIMTDTGLQVERTSNLADSLDLIRSSSHRLAVVDLSLAGGDHTNQDGLLVLDAIKMHDPGCVSILLTGYANVEIAVSAISEHGAITCLRKENFNRRQFRQLVEDALVRALDAIPPFEQSLQEADSTPGTQLTGKHPEIDLTPSGEKSLALVVEDSAAWRETLVELLEDAGFRVHTSASYAEALGRLRRETYHLAVIDLSLDGSLSSVSALWDLGISGNEEDPEQRHGLLEMDGFRLIASTRVAGIPTIVVSGVANPESIERAYAEHAIYAFLPKQVFSRQVFLNTIYELVEEENSGRSDEIAALMQSLTGREQEVLALLAKGMTNKEIAETLVISTNTVKRHLKAVFEKLDVHTRSAAAAKAVLQKK